jgi:hypothetical protein
VFYGGGIEHTKIDTDRTLINFVTHDEKWASKCIGRGVLEKPLAKKAGGTFCVAILAKRKFRRWRALPPEFQSSETFPIMKMPSKGTAHLL